MKIKEILNYPQKSSLKLFSDLSEKCQKLVEGIIIEFDYNIDKILYELNQYLAIEKLNDNISVFDIFCFSLLF